MQALPLETILSILRKWQKERGPVRIISLHSRDPRERLLSESLAFSLRISLERVSSLPALSPRIREATCVLTQRYHGALAALAQGVPFLALWMQEDDKLDALAQLCGCPSVTAHDLSSEILLETNWGEIASCLPAIRQECLLLVQKGEDALRQALQKP